MGLFGVCREISRLNTIFVVKFLSYMEISEVFESFRNKTVFVIGDVMIDSYMWGKTERISPEAPVPVVSVTHKENRMGGAANVGLNIKAMGADAVLCAVIGSDPYGDIFRQLLAKRNMTDIGIFDTSARPTTVKTRVIASSQHLLRVDEEECLPIDDNLSKKFIQHTTRLIDMQKPDAIIFEDYDKGNITPEVIKNVVNKAKQLNIPVLVDPKKRNFFDYNEVTLFKPNFKELAEGMKISINKSDTNQVAEASNALRKKLNADYVLVTLSEAGVLLVGENQMFSMPAQKREIADVSGAGDTVISVLACCFAANVDILTSTVIANIAGGLVCENVGVVPINKEQLLDEATRYFKANSL